MLCKHNTEILSKKKNVFSFDPMSTTAFNETRKIYDDKIYLHPFCYLMKYYLA